MNIAIPKEIAAGETRVAGTPETVRKFVRSGLTVWVGAGAGEHAGFSDEAYSQAGAKIQPNSAALFGEADIVIKVFPPVQDQAVGRHEVEMLRPGAMLVCFLQPLTDKPLLERLAEAKVTSFAMEAVPRITRAQTIDALSSMSTLAGYKAVLLAAGALPKVFPLLITAAGTLHPANVLVIGAGVAGLQAIATARRLGAVVKGVDTRPAVQEQVESLGAKFVSLEVPAQEAETSGGYARDLGEEFYSKQRDVLRPHVKESDVIITTALIPGRPAPRLIDKQMVAAMKPGSVIIDMAAEAGGNCELTEPDNTVVVDGVTIVGAVKLERRLAQHASQMYSRNVASFVDELVKDGQVKLEMDNPVLSGMLATHEGQVVFGRKNE